MSPIIINAPQTEDEQVEDVNTILFDEDGKLTLEGEVVRDFLDFVDWGDVMDSEGAQEHLEEEEILAIVEDGDDGDFWEVDEKEEGAAPITVVKLDGEIAAQLVDEDDLAAMFDYYVQNLPEATLEEKLRKAAFGHFEIEESELTEDEQTALDEGPFKKGSFRKIRKAGGKDQVTRMLLAMLNKESIKRVPKGKGYKKGDYKKHPAGYAEGTPTGIKKWRTYVKKKKSSIEKAAKKAKKGKRIASKFAAKAKSKPGGKAKKKGKKLTASTEPSTTPVLSEGAAMAGSIVGKLGGKPLHEDKDAK